MYRHGSMSVVLLAEGAVTPVLSITSSASQKCLLFSYLSHWLSP